MTEASTGWGWGQPERLPMVNNFLRPENYLLGIIPLSLLNSRSIHMNDESKCLGCGTALVANDLGGVCAPCLEDQALVYQGRRPLKVPAILLLVIAGANLALWLWGVVMVAGQISRFGMPPEVIWIVLVWVVVLWLVLLSLGVIAWGAMGMFRARHYGLALASSILVMLVPPGCVVGLIAGILSLVRLSRRKTRETFAAVARTRAAARRREAENGGSIRADWGWVWGMLAVLGISSLVVGVALAMVLPRLLASQNRRPSPMMAPQPGQRPIPRAPQAPGRMVVPNRSVAQVTSRFPGVVHDLTIRRQEADASGLVFLSLESERTLRPPFPLTVLENRGPSFVELTPELKQWIEQNKVDFLFRLEDERWSLMTLGLQMDFVAQPQGWGTVTLEQVKEVFAAKDAAHLVRDDVPAASFGHDYRGHFTSCTALRTRSNALGVGQWAGLDTAPPSVRLRYQLLPTAEK